MGGDHSDLGSSFNENDWQLINRNTQCKLWQNRRDRHLRIEQYQIFSSNDQEMEDHKQMYYLRKNHPYLISTLYFAQQSENTLCSTQYKYSVFIEKIPIRLSDIEHVPFPDYIHLYHQCLNGYQELASHVGYFLVEEEYIGVNQNSVVKIWLNEDVSKNYLVGGRVTESVMVKSIIDNIDANSDANTASYLPNLKNYMYRNVDTLNFEQAKGEFNEYVRVYCENKIPSRMSCVDTVGGIYMIANRERKDQKQSMSQIDKRSSREQLFDEYQRPRLINSQIFSNEHLPSPRRYQPEEYNSNRQPQQISRPYRHPPNVYREETDILRPSNVRQNLPVVRKSNHGLTTQVSTPSLLPQMLPFNQNQRISLMEYKEPIYRSPHNSPPDRNQLRIAFQTPTITPTTQLHVNQPQKPMPQITHQPQPISRQSYPQVITRAPQFNNPIVQVNNKNIFIPQNIPQNLQRDNNKNMAYPQVYLSPQHKRPQIETYPLMAYSPQPQRKINQQKIIVSPGGNERQMQNTLPQPILTQLDQSYPIKNEQTVPLTAVSSSSGQFNNQSVPYFNKKSSTEDIIRQPSKGLNKGQKIVQPQFAQQAVRHSQIEKLQALEFNQNVQYEPHLLVSFNPNAEFSQQITSKQSKMDSPQLSSIPYASSSNPLHSYNISYQQGKSSQEFMRKLQDIKSSPNDIFEMMSSNNRSQQIGNSVETNKTASFHPQQGYPTRHMEEVGAYRRLEQIQSKPYISSNSEYDEDQFGGRDVTSKIISVASEQQDVNLNNRTPLRFQKNLDMKYSVMKSESPDSPKLTYLKTQKTPIYDAEVMAGLTKLRLS